MTDLGAGVDTMSWTLASVIAGVCGDQAVYTRLKAELDQAVTAGKIKKGEPVTYDVAAKLGYLEACMHEAQRVWPNVAISLPRIVPPGGITVDGYHIAQGSTIGLNSKQLGLSAEVFGPEPESFKPERWLNATKERRHDMENRNLAFGGPSRKCPGMHVAWVCMLKILATTFVNYDIRLLNELNGNPGPAGGKWIEKGSFPTKWFGMEIEISRR